RHRLRRRGRDADRRLARSRPRRDGPGRPRRAPQPAQVPGRADTDGAYRARDDRRARGVRGPHAARRRFAGGAPGAGIARARRGPRGGPQVSGSGGGAGVRCLYLDLDGTLLGRGASLMHDGEGNVTIEGARAIQACLRADVEIVLMSGRRQAQVKEDARLFGQSAYIYEAGACLVLEEEEHWLTGGMVPGQLTVA